MSIAAKSYATLLTLILTILFVLSTSLAFAEIPEVINYQARLLDSEGLPVSDGSYQIRFSIYGSESGDDTLWSSGFQSVDVEGGTVYYMIGSNLPLPNDLFSSGIDRYLGITVDPNPEYSPRIKMSSVGYAYHSLRSDTAGITAGVLDNAITSMNIQDGSILLSDLGQNGASSDQVIKWNGSNWAVAEDEASTFSLPYSGLYENAGPAISIRTTFSSGSAFRGRSVMTSHAGTIVNNVGYVGTADYGIYGADSLYGNWGALGDSNCGVYSYGNILLDNGYLGIGTHTPNGPIHIQSMMSIANSNHFANREAPLVIGDGDSTRACLLIDGNQIEMAAGEKLHINTTSPENVVMVNGGGRIGIGTPNPGNKLSVYGEGSGAGGTQWGEVVAHFKETSGTGYSAISIDGESTAFGSRLLFACEDTARWYLQHNYDNNSLSIGRTGVQETDITIDSDGFVSVTRDFRAEGRILGSTGDTWGYVGGAGGVAGTGNKGVYGQNGNSQDLNSYGYIAGDTIAVYGVCSDGIAVFASANEYGIKAQAFGSNGVGIYAKGGTNGHAAKFEGNVQLLSTDDQTVIVELGEGLDYAEGFPISNANNVEAGTVLIIDPDNAGKLTMSKSAYDKRVAGIVAGARGLGSGIRLGVDKFDCDVALAGRVYCKVEATSDAIIPGDLLTTSHIPGYAMKVIENKKSNGAILGKAMEPLAKGEQGLILVLVTLQ